MTAYDNDLEKNIMNVLVISQRKILPARDGACFFSLGLLNYLHELGACVTLVSFDDGIKYSNDEEKELLSVVSAVYTCQLFWQNTALNFSIRYPNNVRKYTRSSMFNLIKKIKEKQVFDIVIIDHLQMFEYVSLFLDERIILFTHNIESFIWEEYSKKCSGIKQFFVSRSAKMVADYEKRAISKVDGLIAISKEDLNDIKKMVPTVNGVVMPTYYKFGLVKEKTDVFKRTNKLLFIGSYGWYPNQAAARFLALELMPLLQKRIPDIHLYLVGKDPTEEILNYSSNPNIVVTGTVDSVDPYIKECDAFINAVTEGSGVNIKMIEAMGKGIPIVTSDFGTRGLGIINGDEAFIYHDINQCASYVDQLLSDREVAYRMTVRARAFYEQYIQPSDDVKTVIFGE